MPVGVPHTAPVMQPRWDPRSACRSLLDLSPRVPTPSLAATPGSYTSTRPPSPLHALALCLSFPTSRRPPPSGAQLLSASKIGNKHLILSLHTLEQQEFMFHCFDSCKLLHVAREEEERERERERDQRI